MKTIYRNGLGLRYGRMMQAISGVHFNYSFPLPFWEAYAAVRDSRDHGAAFVSASYFDLLRNYRRYGWIVLYLFGISPVVCKSFLRGREISAARLRRRHRLRALRHQPAHERCGLPQPQPGRSCGLGEQPGGIQPRPHPRHLDAAPAVRGARGEGERQWRQLNANILQIENEYYSFIRPKRVARSGERPPRRCGAPVWSTSRCARWMSAPLTPSGSTRTSCAFSRPSSPCA